MAITFERFTRDCPRNDDILAHGGPSRDLIYDYKVLREGEHIATFRRDGNGYELYDRIGRAVVRPRRNWSTHIGEKCPNKHTFEEMIQELAEVIPTAEQCDAWKEAERRREHADRIAAERLTHLARVREAAPIMLGELQNALTFLDQAVAAGVVDAAVVAQQFAGARALVGRLVAPDRGQSERAHEPEGAS
jgi:hypothetical protein